MKRILILALALLMCGAALAEGEGFIFRNGITWGMTPDEVLGAEGNPADYDRDDAPFGVTIIEIEDDTYTGAEGDVNFVFLNDALVVAGYVFDGEDVSIGALADALTAKYGEPIPEDRGRIVAALNALQDGRPRELDETWAFYNWETADGTYIAMFDRIGYIELAYLDEATMLAQGERDVSEPAPALNPDGF